MEWLLFCGDIIWQYHDNIFLTREIIIILIASKTDEEGTYAYLDCESASNSRTPGSALGDLWLDFTFSVIGTNSTGK